MSIFSFMLCGDQPRKTMNFFSRMKDCTCASIPDSLEATSSNFPRPNMSLSIMDWMMSLPSLPSSMP